MTAIEDQFAIFLDHQKRYGRQINSISFPATGSMWLGLRVVPDPSCTIRKSAEIISAVIAVTGVNRNDFFSHRRWRSYAEARQIAYWFLRNYTRLSSPQIGRLIGDRDHATILHGIRTVNANPGTFGPRMKAIAGVLRVELPEGCPFQ